ncbi:hypothetical protein EJB05_32139, partial [Eragrostis curvula]
MPGIISHHTDVAQYDTGFQEPTCARRLCSRKTTCSNSDGDDAFRVHTTAITTIDRDHVFRI